MLTQPAAHDVHGLTHAHISRSIGLARIVLIVGLIFLHYGTFPNSLATPFQGLDIHEHRFATWLNSAILFFFFSAVPLLSMISGWLFFSFTTEHVWPSLKKRIRRRFISLYLPLVVWNAAYFVGIYALYVTHPASFAHLNRLNINFTTAGWLDYVNAVFGVTNIPIGFQFWFVRDLFVTTLISPFLWCIMRYKPWLSAAVLCAIWLSSVDVGIFIRTDVPFFFYMGALIRQKRLSIVIPRSWAILFVLLYIGLAGLRALAPYVVNFPDDDVPLGLEIVTRAMRIAGVLGCWGMIYRAAETNWGRAIGNYGGLAFFLHSAHWPLLSVIKIVTWRFMPGDSDAWMLIHYLISVGVTVTIGLGLGAGLARFCPRLFSFMNGGRLLGPVTEHSIAKYTDPLPTPLAQAQA